jgi:hypothetical protein
VANPIAASPWFQKLCEAAVEVPGPSWIERSSNRWKAALAGQKLD